MNWSMVGGKRHYELYGINGFKVRKDDIMESKDFENLKKEYIKGYKKRLISRFEDMSKRETLLIGSNVTQEDLLMQLIGTIVKTD